MDTSQLETKLLLAQNALNGDTVGAGEFASRIGKPRLILSSVLSCVASWVSSPSGLNSVVISNRLNAIAGHEAVCAPE